MSVPMNETLTPEQIAERRAALDRERRIVEQEEAVAWLRRNFAVLDYGHTQRHAERVLAHIDRLTRERDEARARLAAFEGLAREARVLNTGPVPAEDWARWWAAGARIIGDLADLAPPPEDPTHA